MIHLSLFPLFILGDYPSLLEINRKKDRKACKNKIKEDYSEIRNKRGKINIKYQFDK